MSKLKKITGNPQYCYQCKQEGNKKVLGIWQYAGFAGCLKHRQWLLDMKKERNTLDYNLSEADYQTWWNL